ncbi:MAG TPA: type II toxin-antitoxin system VapC family toxin [Chthonomonadaceae bacterium]|nr:type II toxin-antitoxin system VapC family toxin [Chthonomonadaceae bacterium]
MAVLYADTSALAKRYVLERGSAWLRGMVGLPTGNETYTVRMTTVELIAAITRRERAGTLTPADAARARADFRADLVTGYLVIEATDTLVAQAMTLAETHGLRGYDTVQLAAGLEVNNLYIAAGFPAILFISADVELNIAATAEGLAMENPNAHP